MKMQKHITIASIIGLSLMGLSNITFAQPTYYKWVDAHGSTHYTTTPPPKIKGVKTRGKIQTHGWAPAPVTEAPSNKTMTANNNAQQANTAQSNTNHNAPAQNQANMQQPPQGNQQNQPMKVPQAQ